MTHQGNTTPLRRAAEEGNLGLLAAQLFRILDSGSPGWWCTRILVILHRGEVRTKCCVSLNNATEADLEKRYQRRSEMPGNCQKGNDANLLKMTHCAALSGQHSKDRFDLHDTFASHAVSLLIHPLDIPEAPFLVLFIRP